MDLKLNGKRALVCASSKGLGLEIAKKLFEEGCELIICSRNPKELESAGQEISSFAKREKAPHKICTDLSQIEFIPTFFNQCTELLGGIDILVNNIGGPPPSSASETTVEALQKGFEQIFLSAAKLSQLALNGMKEQKFGRIITITSMSVLEPIDHLVVSTAMRAATTTFMKTLSKEVAPFGITVNTIMPGIIHTDRIINLRKSKAARENTTLELELQKTTTAIPMGRLGRPEELADLAIFLASPKASYITGANIPVDGGMRHSWN